MAKFDPFLSLDCARVEGMGAQSKERKGSNFAAQCSGAIVQKPEGPETYDLKIRLSPSGNLGCCFCRYLVQQCLISGCCCKEVQNDVEDGDEAPRKSLLFLILLNGS